MLNFNPKQTILSINNHYQKALPKINTYYEVIKSYAKDEKITPIALSALGCLSTVFSFFTLPLSTTTVLAIVTVRESYQTWKLFQKAYKKDQPLAPKAPMNDPIKQQNLEPITPPISPAPVTSNPGWLARLIGGSSAPVQPNPRSV